MARRGGQPRERRVMGAREGARGDVGDVVDGEGRHEGLDENIFWQLEVSSELTLSLLGAKSPGGRWGWSGWRKVEQWTVIFEMPRWTASWGFQGQADCCLEALDDRVVLHYNPVHLLLPRSFADFFNAIFCIFVLYSTLSCTSWLAVDHCQSLSSVMCLLYGTECIQRAKLYCTVHPSLFSSGVTLTFSPQQPHNVDETFRTVKGACDRTQKAE